MISEISGFYNDIMCHREIRLTTANMPDMHNHDHYEIYFLVSGKRKYYINDKSVILNPGDFMLIPKFLPHKTSAYKDYTHERLLLSFTDELIPLNFKKEIEKCFNKNIYHFSENETNYIKKLLFKIEKEYTNHDIFSHDIIKNTLFEFFSFIIRSNNDLIVKTGSIHSKINIATDYINNNFYNRITLKTVSEVCNITPEHLSRLFKSETGLNYNDYLNSIRIKHAEKLLSVPSAMSIFEIAMECGFNDSNYFSSVFKKTKGISPYKYRKELQNK